MHVCVCMCASHLLLLALTMPCRAARRNTTCPSPSYPQKWKRVFGEVSDYDDWTEQAKGSVPGREGRDGGWSMPPGTVVKYPPPTPNLNS